MTRTYNRQRDSSLRRELRELEARLNQWMDGCSERALFDPRKTIMDAVEKLDSSEVWVLRETLGVLVGFREQTVRLQEQLASKTAVEVALKDAIPASRISALDDARKAVLAALDGLHPAESS